MDFVIGKGCPCRVSVGKEESEAVKIAAENLRGDLKKVFGKDVLAEQDACGAEICIGTASGGLQREAYSLKVREGKLFISGSDIRGTVYGIYELCGMIGVSPWYFWADVPVRKKERYRLPEGWEKSDYPSVEYRGIFINDEEELEAWAKGRMGEETIGVRTYEKIFELLLRLKANYIWPAMHVNSFNAKKENGALAERMGIVVGTSHCDMLMRSNNREWKPWLAEKGYSGVEYDYSLEGRNREILEEYWRESVEQNREFEVCYTLGMRGVHDSGFETRALEGLEGEELKAAKIRLLQQVIQTQRKILRETLGHETMMTFVPYKEVLPLYDGGLEVPEDITLVWSNDNYGHIRRYPSEKERSRKGGNGIYYHNSYWAPPGMSYVFLCSIPLAHTSNELHKAWNEGIRRLWVLNSGAMKPLEQEIEFFLRLAWEIGKESALTEDVDGYVEDWINRNFTGNIGRRVSVLLNDFSQLTNVRKPELMEQDVFSQTAYGDEAAVRIHEYERLFREGNRIYEDLPGEERAAFFQLVLMRIHAAYFTNLSFYYGDRSTLANRQGKGRAAALYVKQCREAEDARRKMLLYYNQILMDGKWNGILNPEGFPPPRAAMMPVCTPPLSFGSPGMTVVLWNEEEERPEARLSFVKAEAKWLEIGNTGSGSIRFSVQAPDWLKLSCYEGETETEVRILAEPFDVKENRQGAIVITEAFTGQTREVLVETVAVPEALEAVEDGGMVTVEAESASSCGFRKVKRLGRGAGCLMEALGEGEPLSYGVTLTSSGDFLLEIHRFPSLDSVGRIRAGVSVDDGPVTVVESESKDEHLGTWRENVLDNVDLLYLELPGLKAGNHVIRLHGIDKYFGFSRLVLYSGRRKENRFAGAAERLIKAGAARTLPEKFDALGFAGEFYGEITLKPRAVEYARPEKEYDTLAAADLVKQDEVCARQVETAYYFRAGARRFEEQGRASRFRGCILIDAAAVLSATPWAFAEGAGWRHCSSESFGRSGIAMYVAEREGRVSLSPSLNYRINCSGGEYTLWLLAKFQKKEGSFFGVGLDGRELPREELYCQGCLWRYEAEQIYRWTPLVKLALSRGEHCLSLYSRGKGLRIDRIYLTRGSELPPMDSEWPGKRLLPEA